MKNALLVFVSIGILSAHPVLAAGPEPLKLDPANGHYLFFRGKPAVLVTSGEHYGALANLDFNYVPYLDELARNHLNLTRTWIGSYRELRKVHDPAKGGYTIDRNTLAPEKDRFLAPWLKVQRSGEWKYDLTQWNPKYFTRLQDFLHEASRRGIVVELTLFCLMYEAELWKASPMNAQNNVNGVEDVPNTEAYTLKHPKLLQIQEALVRKIVEAASEFDNVYFEIINEPYWQSVPPEWQRHISAVIAEREQRTGVRHLISQNYAQYSEKVVNPDPNVSVFNFHYSRPPDSVAMNYGLNRAIGINETGFDGSADVTYRIQGWDFLVAGGALYNNLDFSFAAGQEHGDFTYQPYTPGGGSQTLRNQLGILLTFFQKLDLPKMSPAPETIGSFEPKGASVRVLAERGKQYTIYLHHGRPVPHQKPQYIVDSTVHSARLQLSLPPGTYQGTWINTKSGRAATEVITVQGDGKKTLFSPKYSEDIALRVVFLSRVH